VIAVNGAATFAGKLADGTAFSTSSRTVDDASGFWVVPVHIPLYTGSTGMLFGEILLPKTEPSTGPDVLGSLGWLCQNATTPFLKALSPAGVSYSLATGVSLLSGTSATGNFTLTIGPSAALSSTLTQNGTWPSTNVPALAKPIPTGMTFSFARATGVFSGTFSQKVNGKMASIHYQGVVLANPLTLSVESHTISAGGFFSGTAGSGPVELMSP